MLYYQVHIPNSLKENVLTRHAHTSGVCTKLEKMTRDMTVELYWNVKPVFAVYCIAVWINIPWHAAFCFLTVAKFCFLFFSLFNRHLIISWGPSEVFQQTKMSTWQNKYCSWKLKNDDKHEPTLLLEQILCCSLIPCIYVHSWTEVRWAEANYWSRENCSNCALIVGMYCQCCSVLTCL